MTSGDDPLEPAPDVTAHLAEVLGLGVTDFVDVLGAGWSHVTTETWHDLDADPSWGAGHELTPWSIAGSPPQVMAHVFHHGAYLARPLGQWAGGTHGLAYQPEHVGYVRRDDHDRARVLISDVIDRRRRSFTWCRCCRELTPPELRVSADTCMACASAWEGAVF